MFRDRSDWSVTISGTECSAKGGVIVSARDASEVDSFTCLISKYLNLKQGK